MPLESAPLDQAMARRRDSHSKWMDDSHVATPIPVAPAPRLSTRSSSTRNHRLSHEVRYVETVPSTPTANVSAIAYPPSSSVPDRELRFTWAGPSDDRASWAGSEDPVLVSRPESPATPSPSHVLDPPAEQDVAFWPPLPPSPPSNSSTHSPIESLHSSPRNIHDLEAADPTSLAWSTPPPAALQLVSSTRPLIHPTPRPLRQVRRASGLVRDTPASAPSRARSPEARPSFVVSRTPSSTASAPEPRENPPALPTVRRHRRHEEHWHEDGNVVFLVDNVLFRVHRFLFTGSSVLLDRMDHCSEGEPIRLYEISVPEFERFLWFLYLPSYSPRKASLDVWLSIYHVAIILQCPAIQDYASKKLDRTSASLPPVDKIVIARSHGIHRWLLSSYVELCAREAPLSVEEAIQLGDIAVFARLARARELLRANSGYELRRGLDWKDPPRKVLIERVVRDAFGLVDGDVNL